MTEMMTPAMRQYYEAKQAYPDTLIFFGWELLQSFGEDAKTMQKRLETPLKPGKTGQGEDASCRHSLPCH